VIVLAAAAAVALAALALAGAAPHEPLDLELSVVQPRPAPLEISGGTPGQRTLLAAALASMRLEIPGSIRITRTAEGAALAYRPRRCERIEFWKVAVAAGAFGERSRRAGLPRLRHVAAPAGPLCRWQGGPILERFGGPLPIPNPATAREVEQALEHSLRPREPILVDVQVFRPLGFAVLVTLRGEAPCRVFVLRKVGSRLEGGFIRVVNSRGRMVEAAVGANRIRTGYYSGAYGCRVVGD
jgi:hypothetical protein